MGCKCGVKLAQFVAWNESQLQSGKLLTLDFRSLQTQDPWPCGGFQIHPGDDVLSCHCQSTSRSPQFLSPQAVLRKCNGHPDSVQQLGRCHEARLHVCPNGESAGSAHLPPLAVVSSCGIGALTCTGVGNRLRLSSFSRTYAALPTLAHHAWHALLLLSIPVVTRQLRPNSTPDMAPLPPFSSLPPCSPCPISRTLLSPLRTHKVSESVGFHR